MSFICMVGESIRQPQRMGVSTRALQSLRPKRTRHVDVEAAEGAGVAEGGPVEAAGVAAVRAAVVSGVGEESEVVERVGRVFER